MLVEEKEKKSKMIKRKKGMNESWRGKRKKKNC